nr:MAG TPA: hypothetical protein [Caudoviricetes sp.]
MSENNNVNYGFDNTLCSVDISSQGADETKIEWIDARKKLPKKGTTLFGGKKRIEELRRMLPRYDAQTLY